MSEAIIQYNGNFKNDYDADTTITVFSSSQLEIGDKVCFKPLQVSSPSLSSTYNNTGPTEIALQNSIIGIQNSTFKLYVFTINPITKDSQLTTYDIKELAKLTISDTYYTEIARIDDSHFCIFFTYPSSYDQPLAYIGIFSIDSSGNITYISSTSLFNFTVTNVAVVQIGLVAFGKIYNYGAEEYDGLHVIKLSNYQIQQSAWHTMPSEVLYYAKTAGSASSPYVYAFRSGHNLSQYYQIFISDDIYTDPQAEVKYFNEAYQIEEVYEWNNDLIIIPDVAAYADQIILKLNCQTGNIVETITISDELSTKLLSSTFYPLTKDGLIFSRSIYSIGYYRSPYFLIINPFRGYMTPISVISARVYERTSVRISANIIGDRFVYTIDSSDGAARLYDLRNVEKASTNPINGVVAGSIGKINADGSYELIPSNYIN